MTRPCVKVAQGDVVVAYEQTYQVIDFDDYGNAVCVNLREDCLERDTFRIFDDLDFSKIVKGDDPVLFMGLWI